MQILAQIQPKSPATESWDDNSFVRSVCYYDHRASESIRSRVLAPLNPQPTSISRNCIEWGSNETPVNEGTAIRLCCISGPTRGSGVEKYYDINWALKRTQLGFEDFLKVFSGRLETLGPLWAEHFLL
ncbi:hypothetical protein KM043_013119 [Ampulex compressa]|nr:hypothetical protein KM043_013119 [Ampulex compressa]